MRNFTINTCGWPDLASVLLGQLRLRNNPVKMWRVLRHPLLPVFGSTWKQAFYASENVTYNYFDPKVRALEKQKSRDEDAQALLDGSKTREDLRRENGAFAFPRHLVRLTPPKRY